MSQGILQIQRRWKGIMVLRNCRTFSVRAALSKKKTNMDFFKVMLQQPQSNVFHRAGMDFLAVEEGPATLRTYSVGNVAHDYLDVHVPPKPEEPLNCCQSGCPICVWDIYADDLREYQDARIRAKKAFIERKMAVPTELKDQQLNAKDPLEQLPPSIHAFVDLEKRLAKKKLENDS